MSLIPVSPIDANPHLLVRLLNRKIDPRGRDLLMNVKDLLSVKGSKVFTISQRDTLWQALEKMVEHNVGALLVLDEEHAVHGILSERDILRRCIHAGKDPRAEVVEGYHTRHVLIIYPDNTLDDAMQLMTQNRIRHLPVVEGRELVGLISIGDVVKSLLHHTRTENQFLVDYITAKYPC
jgi:CBS domain-containing protein